jgi:hypothetical protein
LRETLMTSNLSIPFQKLKCYEKNKNKTIG